jgi:hypothetical protein
VSGTAPGPGRPAVPGLARLGALVIAIGLALDLVEHTVTPHLHDAVVAGFPVGEHVAHLVVLVGMVMVLAGIVADGVRTARRLDRLEGSARNAVR